MSETTLDQTAPADDVVVEDAKVSEPVAAKPLTRAQKRAAAKASKPNTSSKPKVEKAQKRAAAKASKPKVEKASGRSDFVCILDSLVYTRADAPKDGDGNAALTRIVRGDHVENPAEKELDRLRDVKVHPPYGAVAKAGSRLARALARPVPVDEDPKLARLRLDAAAEADRTGNDPDPVDPVAEIAAAEADFSPQTG